MLARLTSPTLEIACIDEVDETASTRQWSKKAAGQLKKLNKDCNMTAGLEANLRLAVGARVMLRCNIDTKVNLEKKWIYKMAAPLDILCFERLYLGQNVDFCTYEGFSMVYYRWQS